MTMEMMREAMAQGIPVTVPVFDEKLVREDDPRDRIDPPLPRYLLTAMEPVSFQHDTGEVTGIGFLEHPEGKQEVSFTGMFRPDSRTVEILSVEPSYHHRLGRQAVEDYIQVADTSMRRRREPHGGIE